MAEPCESRGGHHGLLVPNSPYCLCGRKETLNLSQSWQSCVKVEVDVLGSLPLTVRTVSAGRKAVLNVLLVTVQRQVHVGGLALNYSVD